MDAGSGYPGGHHQRTIALLRALAVASVGLPILMLVIGGIVTWQDKRRDAWEQTTRLTDLVYESVSKLIDAQRLATEQAALMVNGMDDETILAEQPKLHERLHAMLLHLPHLREISVVSRSGHALAVGSRYPAPTADDLSGRDYFQYFRDGGRGLFVGAPSLRYVDNLSFFPLAIRRPSSDDRFTGLIAASVDPTISAISSARRSMPMGTSRIARSRCGVTTACCWSGRSRSRRNMRDRMQRSRAIS